MSHERGDEFNTRKSNIDILAHFREALLIGAQLHLEDRLLEDSELWEKFLADETVEKIDVFVQLSTTNALASNLNDGKEDLTQTFTTKFVNPDIIKTAFSAAEYHEELYIHIPTNLKTKPTDRSEIESMEHPSRVYLEYRVPVLSTKKMFARIETLRYAVSAVDVSFYTSLDSDEEQFDEIDLMLVDPGKVKSAMNKEAAEVSYAIRAIETWDEVPLKTVKRKSSVDYEI